VELGARANESKDPCLVQEGFVGSTGSDLLDETQPASLNFNESRCNLRKPRTPLVERGLVPSEGWHLMTSQVVLKGKL